MTDGIDAERLARELIEEIAAGWENTPDNYHTVQDGSHIFVFRIEPTEVVRYARVVERPASTSVFHFNPLGEAAEIVLGCASRLETRDISESVKKFSLRHSSLDRIRQMLVSAPDVFRDAVWQARVVGETLTSVGMMRTFGRPDIARGLVDSAVGMIEEKVREGFGKIPKTRRPKITDFSIHTALRTFLEPFEQTGAIPSQRQFAKVVGVTPKWWRSFLEKRKLGDHESVVKQWLAELSESDRRINEMVGTLPKKQSPRGD